MIAGGIGTYLITFIGYFTMANSDGDNSAKVPLNERALLTVAVATASMIAGHLLVIANQVIEYLLKFSFKLKYCFEMINQFDLLKLNT